MGKIENKLYGKYAKFWLRLGSILENQNEAVIFSFFIAVLLLPSSQLVIMKKVYKACFGLDSINALVFSTWVFAVVLGGTFYKRARGRRSNRVLRRKHRALRTLQKEKVISATEEQRIRDILVSDYERALRGQSPDFKEDIDEDPPGSTSGEPNSKN